MSDDEAARRALATLAAAIERDRWHESYTAHGSQALRRRVVASLNGKA